MGRSRAPYKINVCEDDEMHGDTQKVDGRGILLGRQGKETSSEVRDFSHGRFRPHGRGGVTVAHHKRSRREDDGAQGIWMLITYCLSKA